MSRGTRKHIDDETFVKLRTRRVLMPRSPRPTRDGADVDLVFAIGRGHTHDQVVFEIVPKGLFHGLDA